MFRSPRSNSRLSMSSKQGGGSRASDDDAKTAVKVDGCYAMNTAARRDAQPFLFYDAVTDNNNTAVRVRPPLKPTDPGYELIPQRFQRSMVHVTSPTSIAVDVPQGRKLFVFDRVFPETVDQEGIWEYLSDSVNSFIQGYNVSILAYGQSGAGKSYTMGTSGPNEQNNSKAMGVIPRAAQLLFEKLDGTPPTHTRSVSTGIRTPSRYSMSSTTGFGKNGADKNWQLKATYVEIYNEQLRDLLIPDTGERAAVTIREDAKGRIILTGLHQVTINSFEDLIGALNFGSSIRQTDSTAVNAKSSRSHAVFSLNLVQRKSSGSATSTKEKRLSMPVEAMSGSDASVTVDSKLHFVDLAGSERLKNTGASGERAREGISINAGLASLGKVISQLSSRQSGAHVSYRDSKLTRLLQDSLGGNAITYMIACVTPAEFHLSETLNTVQYAQRARAIQSKPRIQQVADESDKQAVIDRLKAEVAFLRQQIRNSEANDRRSAAPAERSERQNEREIELQNHLLDVQESYNALSQRHAKLMAELTKASDFNGEPEEIASMIGNNSVERLRRSHSFAESVEQVVLEYEKTIQSLESSLSNTRSSLSSTESNLLERETKLAYVETVNSQLQARLQKMMDRESNTETYLHELESKLDGHTSGEEQQSAVVAELRRELARVRETEASCEDYISTLEERLAEADQDMELMQREIERLEHVVDRQRSLGKLDNLLYELDHIQQNGTKKTDGTNGEQASDVGSRRGSYRSRKRAPSLDVLAEAAETAIPESDDDLAERMPDVEEEEEVPADVTEDSGLGLLERASKELGPSDVPARDEYAPESPAQSKFVAEKLDTVTQELLDLREQHEATTTEYEALAVKYEETLRALEKLQQDAADESRHPTVTAVDLVTPTTTSRPSSFLGDPRVRELKTGAHHSSSQSLSSELSLVGESAGSPEASDATSFSKKENGDVSASNENMESSPEEVESMRRLLSEHQEGMALVTQKYAQLQAEHEETLGLIEDLKVQVQKAKSAPSPTSPSPKGVIRRMTSQNLMSTVDRAHRSLAALRNIAAEEFEDRPDTMQNFELNLNAAMHELHTRMERIQSLEAENMSVKKEMETKSTIISGLARERSSLQGSTADMTVVSQLREQLVQQENQMRELQEMHEKREKGLLAEIQNLSALLESQEAAAKANDVHAEKQEQKISELESELFQWKGKHQTAIESLQSSETRLKESLAELETSLAAIETMRSERASATDTSSQERQAELEQERLKHQEVVDSLTKEIEDHKSTIAVHLETISGLEKTHTAAREQLAQREGSEGADDKEITSYKTRISELEQEISTHKSIIDAQNKDLESLQESHTRELAELESRVAAAAQAEHESRLAEQNEAMESLRSEISESKDELTKLLNSVSKVLSTPVTAASLSDHLEDIVAQKQHFSDKYSELIDANEELTKQLDMKGDLNDKIKELTAKSSQQESKVNELAQLIAELEEVIQQKEEEVKKKDEIIEEINAEKDKSARLVEELEEQITNSFDQHQNRLSVIQQERSKALDDANAKITVYEKDIESYRTRIEQLEAQLKRNSGAQDGSLDRNGSITSNTSNLRKNSSTASLPSPPPAIPLPPLPTIASAASGNPGSMSPPSSRHTSKELVNAQLVEDQEARIRTIEKHLYAEKQLTATLEEALGDLEAQSNKVKADMEAWKKKAWQYEDELTQLRKERNSTRLSIQAVEEERNARREAEAARAQLEERMNAINKKKKKSTLNCF
ncbi:conserved hypothetical protein [Paecilomyces variotii No. 5]|uniref:Kinesin motor domain-containing protein n=1 Tax=Byssochlamys spectabilis (strain No. 5 / NBRC 109023) TaxID=1356009 RepID=V5HUA0_BYSSN|nr:conserved hypothetical protein [Paecilomyces variotii No. 5]